MLAYPGLICVVPQASGNRRSGAQGISNLSELITVSVRDATPQPRHKSVSLNTIDDVGSWVIKIK